MDEWLTFEDVMIQLRVTSDELKRMIGEGELQPFRGPDGAMRFKAADVQALKTPPPSPPTDVLVIKPTDPIPPEVPTPRAKPAKKKAKKPAPKKPKKGASRKKKR